MFLETCIRLFKVRLLRKFRGSLWWAELLQAPNRGLPGLLGVYLAIWKVLQRSPKHSKNHTFSCSEFALCIFSNSDAHRRHRLMNRRVKNRNRQGRKWEMMNRVRLGWKFKNQNSHSIWPWKGAGRATLLAWTFWIYRASFVSCPAQTNLHAITGMLSERQNCSSHPLSRWKMPFLTLPCTKGWSPTVCCWRALTTWPCLPHGFVFLFSTLPNTGPWQHRRVRSCHLPALCSWDIYL